MLVFFLVVIDVSAVTVAFPSIAEDFGVSTASLGWIVSGYNITVAALLLVAGRLGDSLGRKKVFIPGVAIFMVGSALSGIAPTPLLLVGARVLQAVGGAILSPTALAVVLADFPASKRSTVIGITGATGGLGAVAGPALGSVVIDLWSWRGIFLLNVPICLLVLFLAPRLLRESKDPDATGRIDFLGVPIGTAGIVLVMLAIVQAESWGLADPRGIAIFVVGLALVWALVKRSQGHREPLLELELYRSGSFRSSSLGVAFYSLAFTSGFLVSSLLLQSLWKQSIRTTGVALMVAPFLTAVFAPLSGRMADRLGHRWILTGGSLLCAAGYFLSFLLLDGSPQVFSRFVPISVLLGIGIGATIATWSSAALSDVGPAKFGTAAAMLRTVQQVFYALGISIVLALITAGTGVGGLQGFRWAWLFVAAMYTVAAVLTAATFPSGTSSQRAAQG